MRPGSREIGFNESLQRGHRGLTGDRNSGGVPLLLETLHPAPPAPLPDGSLDGWIWLTVVLAVVVLGGIVLTSRR